LKSVGIVAALALLIEMARKGFLKRKWRLVVEGVIMVMQTRNKHRCGKSILQVLCLLTLCSCWLCVPDRAYAEAETSAWGWRVGPSSRFGARFHAEWSAAYVNADFESSVASRLSSLDPIGPANGYANRTYVDGFVYMDSGTADPETDTPGVTWYWGYDHASQHSGNAISFHSAPVAVMQSPGQVADSWSGSQEFRMSGAEVAVGRRLWRHGWFAVGVSAGASFYQQHSLGVAVRREAVGGTISVQRYVDTYAAPYEPFPQAPYAGTYPGPGYLLQNEPTSRRLETQWQSTESVQVESNLDIDLQMLDFRVGPASTFMPNEWITLRLVPHVRIAHVEIIALARTQVGQIGYERCEREKDWIVGGGLEIGGNLAVGGSAWLGVSAAADWWADDMAVEASPFAARLEFGQWTIGITLGQEF
jgi:hypothetical protein